MEQLYCANPECDPPRELDGHGEYCSRCTKRYQRHGREGLSAPFVEKLSPTERVRAAARAVEDCPSDDDAEYARREKALDMAIRALESHRRREKAKRGAAAAKARGVALGPKLKVKPLKALKLVEELGSILRAAKKLRRSRGAIYRALKRVRQSTRVFHNAPLRNSGKEPSNGPRPSR